MELKNSILKYWQNADKEGFSILLAEALQKGTSKEDILNYLEVNKNDNSPNEEFEEWAYKLIASEGQSECALG